MRTAARRQPLALSVLTDTNTDSALVHLGTYLLLRSTRDLVQRVLQAIAARASDTSE